MPVCDRQKLAAVAAPWHTKNGSADHPELALRNGAAVGRLNTLRLVHGLFQMSARFGQMRGSLLLAKDEAVARAFRSSFSM
jgi:hypothetical protein